MHFLKEKQKEEEDEKEGRKSDIDNLNFKVN